MNKEQKTNVKFKDGNNNLYSVDIEITHKNGYPEFSMSGEGDGSMGQCKDRIKPKNPKQKRLIELWNKYHLNGTNAGTPKQTEKLEEMKGGYEYDKACQFLNSFDQQGTPIINFDVIEIEQERKDLKERIEKVEDEIEFFEEEKELQKCNSGGGFIQIREFNIEQHYNTREQFNDYFKKQKLIREKQIEGLKEQLEKAQEKTILYDRGRDGKLYKYGATWHRVDLPENLWEEVQQLVKDIEEIEELSKATGGKWEDLDYKVQALGKYLELEPKEAEEDIEKSYDGVYSHCATDYYVLTETEAYDRAEEYLGDELWEMVVAGGHTELGKKDWIEHVISTDGFGNTLNSYDGTEYFDEEHNVYIMRC